MLSPLWLLLIAATRLWQVPSNTPIREAEKKLTQPPLRSVNGYSYDYFVVNDPQNLQLVLNRDNIDAIKLAQINACQFAINGGFYTTNKTPLGLLKIANQIISQQVNSALLDGYIVSDEQEWLILSQEPNESYPTVLQTGPHLIIDNLAQSLQIVADEPRRRSVFIKSQNGQPILLTVYANESVFQGPYLKELPELLIKISQQEQIEFSEAINLDGGAASFFLNNKRQLNEFRTVKTLFCLVN